MGFSRALVVDARALSPRLHRVSLRVEDPVALAIPPDPDAAVGVYFDAASPGAGRTYSVRRHDGPRIDLDIVLHSGGPGADWARAAAPGHRVGLDHANAWYRPPPDTAWQLLVTDLAGLPATARILEAAPAAVATTVVVEAPDQQDLGYLPDRPGVTVVSSAGTGNGLAPCRLAEVVRRIDLPDHGYCWFAGEASQARAVRKYLRGRGWSTEHYDITGYWRRDSDAWDARFALIDDDLFAVYQRAIAEGKGNRLAFEEFDDALERLGL